MGVDADRLVQSLCEYRRTEFSPDIVIEHDGQMFLLLPCSWEAHWLLSDYDEDAYDTLRLIKGWIASDMKRTGGPRRYYSPVYSVGKAHVEVMRLEKLEDEK